MLGLLTRVVIGVAVGGLVGGAAVAVYKYLTKDSVREEINNNLRDSDIFDQAFKAKVKRTSEDGHTVNVDVMDEWDNPICNMDINGDETSSEIYEGAIILLKAAC